MGSTLTGVLNYYVSNNWKCEEHNLLQLFFSTFVTFYIHTWTTNINKILRGLETKNINNPIKKIAVNRYVKYKKRKTQISFAKKLVS